MGELSVHVLTHTINDSRSQQKHTSIGYRISTTIRHLLSPPESNAANRKCSSHTTQPFNHGTSNNAMVTGTYEVQPMNMAICTYKQTIWKVIHSRALARIDTHIHWLTYPPPLHPSPPHSCPVSAPLSCRSGISCRAAVWASRAGGALADGARWRRVSAGAHSPGGRYPAEGGTPAPGYRPHSPEQGRSRTPGQRSADGSAPEGAGGGGVSGQGVTSWEGANQGVAPREGAGGRYGVRGGTPLGESVV